MIAVCGVLILAIVLFSVVVIYNIFQVGIANKIQEYGKSRLWERQKADETTDLQRGHFLTFFQYQLDCFLAF